MIAFNKIFSRRAPQEMELEPVGGANNLHANQGANDELATLTNALHACASPRRVNDFLEKFQSSKATTFVLPIALPAAAFSIVGSALTFWQQLASAKPDALPSGLSSGAGSDERKKRSLSAATLVTVGAVFTALALGFSVALHIRTKRKLDADFYRTFEVRLPVAPESKKIISRFSQLAAREQKKIIQDMLFKAEEKEEAVDQKMAEVDDIAGRLRQLEEWVNDSLQRGHTSISGAGMAHRHPRSV